MIESFSADWLTLREPADHAARASTLTDEVAARLARRTGQTLRAVDLAAGTGSNVRYLLPRVPAVAHWTLVDHDAALLARAFRGLSPLAVSAGRSVDVRQADLNDLSTLPLDACALVTASALLDLVSETWLRRLARRCREVGADVLCALSYDGRVSCEPADPFDTRIRELVNQHQRTDKGFGAALGPDATDAAAAAFSAEGFAIATAPSVWMLAATHSELQRQLVEGWAGAARGMAPAECDAIDRWRDARVALAAAGTLRCQVGHVDLSASLA